MSCGLIMFNEKNEVLIVESDKGTFSLPKGKVEKYDLSNYECARREFLEETGMYGFIYKTDKIEIESKSKKPGKKITYFLCKIYIRLECYQEKLCDPDHDIIDAKFYTIEDALKIENLEEERKHILREAIKKINEKCDLNIFDIFLSPTAEQHLRVINVSN